VQLNVSKWTETVRSVTSILDDDIAHFELEFPFWDRTKEYLRVEYKNLKKASKGNVFVAIDGVLYVIIDFINVSMLSILLPPRCRRY
jgi:hypothetical protein